MKVSYEQLLKTINDAMLEYYYDVSDRTMIENIAEALLNKGYVQELKPTDSMENYSFEVGV